MYWGPVGFHRTMKAPQNGAGGSPGALSGFGVPGREGRLMAPAWTYRGCAWVHELRGAGPGAQALYAADAHGWTRITTMQDHHNLLHRDGEREMLPLCVDQRIGVMPWSPLARGRLTRDWDAATSRSDADELGRLLCRTHRGLRLIHLGGG